jgi:hypothetical protein
LAAYKKMIVEKLPSQYRTKDPHLTKSGDEEQFAAWLATQRNSNGQLFKSYVANGYARNLRTEPPKLDIPLTLDERDVFSCRSVDDFDKLNRTFRTAPNFREVNTGANHGAFSAGLAAYRRYVQYIDENGEPEMEEQKTSASSAKTNIDISPAIRAEPQRVDFSHPEYCTNSDPVSCFVEGNDFSGGNWRDILVALTESFLLEKPKAKDLFETSLYQRGEREFILKDKPKFSSRQLSNGCWINMNLSIKDLVFTIGKLCQFCDVNLNDVKITYTPKLNRGNSNIQCERNVDSSVYTEQPIRAKFRAWIVDQHPDWSYNTVTAHISDAYYLYNNDRGVTLAEALNTDAGFQKAYDAIEQHFVNNPAQTNNPSGSARGYIRSLRMLKDFLEENHPELLAQNGNAAIPATTIPDELIEALNHNYATGFRFETTYISLLSNAAEIEVDEKMQAALKRIMFRRDDGIHFLLDVVADAMTRKDIVDFADSYLQEYGCFEMPEFFMLYEDKVNPACIRNADDFESFYEQIGKSGVRFQAPYVGNRIARYSNGSVWGTFKEVAAKIVAVISEEYYGSCNEDDLHSRFCAFSTDLLGKIIKQCAADDLIRVEINGSVCYQTYDALGLPDDFSEQLVETIERLDEIGLTIDRDALHTALSLKLGVNFMAEFNLPDWDTFQRLTVAFYKAEPRREWKHYIFGEVTS